MLGVVYFETKGPYKRCNTNNGLLSAIIVKTEKHGQDNTVSFDIKSSSSEVAIMSHLETWVLY